MVLVKALVQVQAPRSNNRQVEWYLSVKESNHL
jgi:hypothetical protein